MPTSEPAWRWLGRVPYAPTLERQRTHRDAVIARERPEEIWLLEHDPVVTTGRRAVDDLPDAAFFAARGIELHHAERGGLATYHGPGQLVAYVMVDAWGRGLGVKGLVSSLEHAVADYLGSLGIEAGFRKEHRGVWVDGDKICAVGLHFRKGVSMHGLALNLTTDLSPYALFTPCGITDAGVTSAARVLGRSPDVEEAAPGLAAAILRRLLPRSSQDSSQRPEGM